MAAWVEITHGVVIVVAIAICGLRVECVGYYLIRTNKAIEHGVVEPRAHVLQTGAVVDIDTSEFRHRASVTWCEAHLAKWPVIHAAENQAVSIGHGTHCAGIRKSHQQAMSNRTVYGNSPRIYF